MRDVIRPWHITGGPVNAISGSTSPIPQRAHSALKSSPAARLLRQALWTRVPILNPRLLAWLDEYRPEVVFFCGGDAAALYPKVASLAERYAAPLVYYITDDYVLPAPSRNLASRLSRRWTRRVFAEMTSSASLVLTIGTTMSRRYTAEFGFDSVPVMNMVDVPPTQPAMRTGRGRAVTLMFAGTLHSGRWTVLSQVADSVERLADRGVDVTLVVYGPEPVAEALVAVSRPPRVEYRGLLTPAELSQAIREADVLVHVESDDPASVAVTSLSVSTKIPEYLVSGRSILAVGPRGLASIDYLEDHRAALVVEPQDPEGLDTAIETLALADEARRELATRGFELASANHQAPKTRQKLWRHLEELVV
jgi:glycosyltransferase involved in cell wall biosynthesis